jgi:predicted metal-binding protein
VARPVLSVCTRCGTKRRHRDAARGTGEDLAEAVRALRKKLGLKEVFKIEEVHCLSLCDSPCAVQLEGKKRSTIARVGLSVDDAAALIEAARAYAALMPGQELPERALPGEHAD